ncbi:glycoside hydrolase family 16 protein [Flavobacterium cellulosilyticum]|uniref:Glycoside hydrolase family 16 protein n=1 Tax=Flavobacterium cellulosilyticum TaxID=2541731 RepID=A0A4R5C728_9FLAO|nr:glycoside hydrolase family 16 protein [Flavobacterium cellulosilyticum]TDD95518.1 glycoside hydrolase family 16 protein [Flavobacterium cellulosilyticum]
MIQNTNVTKLNTWRTTILLSSLIVFAFGLISCSSDGGSGGGSTVTTPSNLVLTAQVFGTSTQNPNGDGSGTVNFNFNATNATSYKIALGDGVTQDVSSGVYSYTYTTSGTTNFKVFVSAYNGANFISTSITINVYVAPTTVWSDEFNIDGAPNNSKWGYDVGGGGWGNNEAQNYTNRADNVIIQGGVLKIIIKKENYQGSNYTSARLLTKGKFSFKYGKVEMRAKLPSGGGTWPALWMLGDNISTTPWPACGEIDMMEHVGNQLNKIFGTLHYTGHSGGNADSTTLTVSTATTDFHIYSIDWRADAIKFYVDNQLFKTFVNTSSLPFNQNFFLIFNCAIGGDFGGAIDPNFASSTFEIDYVRVYN